MNQEGFHCVFLNVSAQFVGPRKAEALFAPMRERERERKRERERERESRGLGEAWVGGDIVKRPFWKATRKSLAHGNQSQKRVPQKKFQRIKSPCCIAAVKLERARGPSGSVFWDCQGVEDHRDETARIKLSNKDQSNLLHG